MKDTFAIKVCEKCGKKTAEEVIECVPNLDSKRKGWYCTNCYHWDRAIGREKVANSE